MICETDPHSPMDPVAYPNFLDWRAQSQVFAELSAFQVWNFNLRTGETAVHVRGAWVSTNYFRLWQLAPIIGRTFVAENGVSARPEVVVSYGFWQRRFGGDRRILGSTLALDEIGYTVIGVMPASFTSTPTSAPTEVWAPIDLHADQLMDRGQHLDLFAYGRMKPGVNIERAQSEMDTIARRLAKEFPGVNTDVGVRLTRPGELAVGPIRPTLLILSGSVIAVALLVFANVSCLLLARAGARRNEIAVRTALGASRWQTARPFVAESMLVSLAGGCLGALLARATPTRLLALAYLRDGRGDIEVSGTALAFAVCLAVAGGLLWGVIPLLRGAPRDASEPLKETGRTTAGGWWLNRFAAVLVVADIALALTFMFVAGLLVRGYARLQSANPGINPDKLLTMQVALPRARYTGDVGVTAFYRQLLERAGNIPGVDSAAAASFLPLSGYWAYTPLQVAGSGYVVHQPVTDYLIVTPGYFHTMQIPILKGRPFAETDDAGSAMVAIVDELAAKFYWPGRDPLGTRLRVRTWKPDSPWMTVVGVVGRVQHYALDRDAGPLLYLPFAQNPQLEMRLAVRTAVEPRSLAETVVRTLRPLNRDQAAFNISTMRESLSQRMAFRRFTTAMLTALALVALVVAAVGVFGVLSYAVSQRTQEIGIRMALGAQAFTVRRMVVGEGMRLVLRGLAIGAVLAAPAADLLSNLIFGLKAADLPVLVGVSAVLAMAALLACYLPARTASTVDPMVALRHQ